MFDETFNVDVALDQAEILSHLIEEEMSMGDMMTLLKLRRGNYSVVEEKIVEGAHAIGVPIKDLGLPEHCVIAAIIRKGEVLIPRGTASFEAGDEVLAVTDSDGARLLGWGLTLDMLGYYLALLPAAIFLHKWLEPKNPAWVRFFTVCGLGYILLGAAGAAMLASALPPWSARTAQRLPRSNRGCKAYSPRSGRWSTAACGTFWESCWPRPGF